MKDDPTIARMRAARHQISERYQHDPQQVIQHYIEFEKQHPRRFIELTRGTIVSADVPGKISEQQSDRVVAIQ